MKKEEAGTPGLATASLVFGILSIFLGWIPLLGWIFVILALVFGIIALKKIRKENLPGKGTAITGTLLGLVGVMIAVGMMTYISNTQTTPANQPTISIESSYYVNSFHQINQSFSVQNREQKALTNVVVEAYLLDIDQNVSKEFTYIDHKQLNLGTLNPTEHTKEYSVVLGRESPDLNYSAYVYMKASSAEGKIGISKSDVIFVSAYSSEENFNKIYCPKIDPYNIEVRKAASEAVRAHPGDYSIDQLLDIYDWIQSNVNYLNVPVDLPATPYSPPETLATKSGDCKNQAVLIASMIKSIGGDARVVIEPSCTHAYTIVSFPNKSPEESIDKITNHYFPCRNGFQCGGKCWNFPTGIGAWCDGSHASDSDQCPAGQVGFTDNMCHYCQPGQTLIMDDNGIKCKDTSNIAINWFDYQGGKWIIFDSAGGLYPGNTLPECLGDHQRYFVDTCVKPPE